MSILFFESMKKNLLYIVNWIWLKDIVPSYFYHFVQIVTGRDARPTDGIWVGIVPPACCYFVQIVAGRDYPDIGGVITIQRKTMFIVTSLLKNNYLE